MEGQHNTLFPLEMFCKGMCYFIYVISLFQPSVFTAWEGSQSAVDQTQSHPTPHHLPHQDPSAVACVPWQTTNCEPFER